jgi:hypothetical protein
VRTRGGGTSRSRAYVRCLRSRPRGPGSRPDRTSPREGHRRQAAAVGERALGPLCWYSDKCDARVSISSNRRGSVIHHACVRSDVDGGTAGGHDEWRHGRRRHDCRRRWHH